MTPERRKQVVLVALFLALAVVVWARLGSLLSPGADGGVPFLSSRSRNASPDPLAGGLLKLAELGPEVRSYEVQRDPFRFGEPPRPPAPPTPPTPRPKPVVYTAPPPQPVDTGPQPPPLDLTYLGRFGPVRRPIAVFTDGENIINAREGDVVGEHFLVLGIGLESVDVGYVDFPDLPAQRLGVGS